MLGLLATPLALLTPVPLALVADSVLGSEPVPRLLDAVAPDSWTDGRSSLLATAVIMAIVIALLSQLQTLMSTVLANYSGELFLLDVRSQLFDRAQRASLAMHDTRGTADTLYRIQYDAKACQAVTLGVITSVLASAVTLVTMFFVMFALSWKLSAVALAVTPLTVVLARSYRWRLRQRYRTVKELESSALGVLQETLSTLRVVKAFGQEDEQRDSFVRSSRDGIRARIWAALAEGVFGIFITLSVAMGTSGVLYFGAQEVLAGRLTLGRLILFMGYLSQLYSPVKTLSKKIAAIQGSLASVERVVHLLDERPEVEERPNAVPIQRARGDIEFCNVTFSYDGEQEVLSQFSCRIPRGRRVGISGPTGAGKTTMVNLLLRLYDPTTGCITLDGRDLRDYRLPDLRRQFAVVLQEPVLFSTSIAENIAYGRPEANFDEITKAAMDAGAHEFIMRFTDQYGTLVGERGMLLSGGERQRIGLARAFLRNAPILILDEPTSAVDVHTEAQIMDALEQLMVGRTTLMIAHRLSTLDHCDTRIEIADGRVIRKADREIASHRQGSESHLPPRISNGTGARHDRRRDTAMPEHDSAPHPSTLTARMPAYMTRFWRGLAKWAGSGTSR